MSNWYLVQYKKNSFRLAERNLNQQDIRTFLPLQDFTNKRGAKFSTGVRPLFPGYMFVDLENDKTPWRKINNTIGVSRLICQDGVPRRVPIEIVSGLMSRCDRFGKLLPPKSLERGDKVVFLSGALTNFVATVETVDSNERIWVLMDIMGQLSKVQVAPERVKILS